MNSIRSCNLFLQLLRRECFVYRYRIQRYVINYLIIYPFLHSVCFGYLQAKCYFGLSASKTGTLSFAGVGIIMMMITAYRTTFDIFHDLLDYKNMVYRITVSSINIVLAQHLVFGWIASTLLMLPFYPVASLLAGSVFNMSNTQWPYLMLMIISGCLCCVSYHIFAAICLTRIDHLSAFWFRGNFVMLVFGGAWIPHYVIETLFPSVGMLTYALPITYLSDGLRQAIIGGPQFLPLSVCIAMLLLFSSLFIVASHVALKKRLDLVS